MNAILCFLCLSLIGWISEEVFASVQIEKERRTNLERTSNGVRRKETRYKSTYEHYTLDLRQEDDPSNI